MEIHRNKNKVCVLCFTSCGSNYLVIDDDMRRMMALLLLSCDFGNEQPLMCDKCVEDLKTCYDFKLLCLSSNNSVLINDDNCTKVLEQKADEHNTKCRLCMNIIGPEFFNHLSNGKSDEKLRVQLNTYFPELTITASQYVSICTSCDITLEAYFDIMRNWSYAEKNDEGNMLDHEHDMDFHTDQSSFENETKDEVETHDCHLTLNVYNVVASKLQEINNKHEEIDSKMDEDHYKRFKDNASGCSTANVPVEKHTTIKKSISDAADALTLKNLLADHKFPTKVLVYKCEKCQFETKHKNSMKKHTFTHQEPSEAILYHCDKCDFKTKHKDSLKLHLDLHQEPSKVSMYRCRICQFETKRKVYLKKHMLTHQNPSEVILYRCDICAFKTKHKQSLTRHMERHRDPSRISMYQCSKCHFGIKHKDCLKKQVLIHYDPSETTMHHCDKCEFKTKRKNCLELHMIIHRDSSKVYVYQCERCRFETKNKADLKKHITTHHLRHGSTLGSICD